MMVNQQKTAAYQVMSVYFAAAFSLQQGIIASLPSIVMTCENVFCSTTFFHCGHVAVVVFQKPVCVLSCV